MLSSDDLIVKHLSGAEWGVVEDMAKRSCIGGRSTFRTGNRMATLKDDQLVGHAVGWVATKHLFGSAQKYIEARAEQDTHPYTGDGGVDILCSNIDFKGTRWRRGEVLDKSFVIGRRDYGEEKVYIFALVALYTHCASVCLVGYTTGARLQLVSGESGLSLPKKFRGYYIRAIDLNPLPRFIWRTPC